MINPSLSLNLVHHIKQIDRNVNKQQSLYEFENKHYSISTFYFRKQMIYFTAVRLKNMTWEIVGNYKTESEARNGHLSWIEKMKNEIEGKIDAFDKN